MSIKEAADKEIWPVEVTAMLFLKNLVRDLYEGPGACLMEIIRNGLCACMPKGIWQPKRAWAQVLLEDHPVARGTLSLGQAR